MAEIEAPSKDIEILLQLHNMAAVRPEKAVGANEVARILMMKSEELDSRLADLAEKGYVTSFLDELGIRRFHLTGIGIIKVASLFS